MIWLIFSFGLCFVWSLALSICLWRYRKQGVNSVGVVASHECAISDLHEKLSRHDSLLRDIGIDLDILARYNHESSKRLVRLELRDIVHYETIQ